MAFWCRGEVTHLERGVVKIRGRRFPSATLAGDALWVWRRAVRLIQERAEKVGDAELINESRRLRRTIDAVFDEYNDVCKRRGLGGFDEPEGEGVR